MPTIAEMKASSPDYAALTDEEFASRVYAKHYAGTISREEFDRRTGGGKKETWGDYGRGLVQKVGQGVTLGFGDEIGAALGVAGNVVARGLGADIPEKTYSDILEEIRAPERQFEQRHPVQSMAAEIGGGIATGAGAARAIAAAPTLAARVGRSAATGAGSGAAAGFGTGEGGVGNRLAGAGVGGGIGAVAGPIMSEVVGPAVMRTAQGIGAAARYGRQAIRNARNPEQAAIENVADRGVAAGLDWDAVRRAISPTPSPALARRGVTDENLADIISRNLQGETAASIGQRYGINAATVRRYVRLHEDNNPTPLNIIDIAKEQLGEGGAAPIARLGRAAYSLAGDDSGAAAQRLTGRQETQAGRAGNIVQRSVAGGDFEATRAAGLQNLQDEARAAYRQFYAEPDLATDQLGDLMADPVFRSASLNAQRNARVEAIRRNQAARRAGQPEEPVPDVDPENAVFSPEMLDQIQRQLRIAGGGMSDPNAARHAQNLREVFLDRIEDFYPTFRDIRRNYATGLGQFGEEGALEAGAALTGRLGAPAREALRGFDGYTPAQQELFRLGFARKLMDDIANRQTGAAITNQFSTQAVREIVERIYPRSNAALYAQGQRLLRDLRREATTTRTKNDVMAGARSAELGSDMGRMMEGAKTAADVATGRWGTMLENLSTRLSTQIGRRGAREVLDLLTQTDPAQLLPLLNRLARAAQTTAERQAYAATLAEARRIGVRRLSAMAGQTSGVASAQGDR